MSPNAGGISLALCALALFSLLVVSCPVPSSGAALLTNLYSFNRTNGAMPYGSLLQSGDGSMIGTLEGGTGTFGSVFKLTSSGTLTTLGTFYFTNGSEPLGPFVQTQNGSIYGTTWSGGPGEWGTVFELGSGGLIKTLVSFDGTNGASPRGLITGSDGAFYGVTMNGGMGFNGQQFSGNGTIFMVDTNGNFSPVFQFNGTNGSLPAALILGADGALYGTTAAGGSSFDGGADGGGAGSVFRFTSDGNLTTLFSFNFTNGCTPGQIIQATDGNLYGITLNGGASYGPAYLGNGTVFRLATNGTFTKLTDLPASQSYPVSIMQAGDGSFYGTAVLPVDSIFHLTTNGILKNVYTFQTKAPL